VHAAPRAPGSQLRGGSRVPGGFAPGHVFVSGYAVLLVLFGIVPVVYSLYLALTRPAGGFAGFGNFIQTAEDYRFLPAIGHVAAYIGLWLVSLTVLVTLLALVVHRLASRRTRTFIRFAYYVPGALAGASSVLLWLFVLNPSVSPVSLLLKWTGNGQFGQVIQPSHLPLIFTVIAFWTGAGGWILVLYGALNTVPADVLEAATVDGAGPVRTAWRVQLPMIGKWITYMLILSLAAGTQLFVEPQLLSQSSFGVVSNYYSANQLAYQYAFNQDNFNGAAAISVDLLVVALICATVLIARGRLFRTD
jgi:multiple sugar transport system permease protein